MNEDFLVKVSIIIPSYNNSESFKRTITSVINQDYNDYEIIVTDDSNNDDIQNLVDELNHPKIRYFKNLIPLGVPENWNEGLKKASGEYIKIIHHDDWFENKDSLRKFIDLLDKNPDSDFGYSKSVNVDLETCKIKKRKAEKYVKQLSEDCFELFFNNRIGAPSVTIFRNGKNIFFDKNLTWVVDVDFYIQWLLKNKNIAFINEILINIGISHSQVSNSCLNNGTIEISEQLYLYNKYKEFLKDPKYKKPLKRMIKQFKIENLASLKDIIPPNIELPQELFKRNGFNLF